MNFLRYFSICFECWLVFDFVESWYLYFSYVKEKEEIEKIKNIEIGKVYGKCCMFWVFVCLFKCFFSIVKSWDELIVESENVGENISE